MKKNHIIVKCMATLLSTVMLLSVPFSVFADENVTFDSLKSSSATQAESTAASGDDTSSVTAGTAAAQTADTSTETSAVPDDTVTTDTANTTDTTAAADTTDTANTTDTTDTTASTEATEPSGESASEQVSSTQNEWKTVVGDTTITATADKGVLDAGLTMTAVKTDVPTEVMNTVTDKAIADQVTVENIAAYDIKFTDVNGNEVEPNGVVNVTMSTSTQATAENTAVYHYDETQSKVEDMQAAPDDNGDASFDTTHFSKYTIVNTGSSEIQVTIQHYNASVDPATKLYSDDTRTLKASDKITNYTKAINETGTNWEVGKIVVTPSGGQSTTYQNDTEHTLNDAATLNIVNNTKVEVYYTAKTSSEKNKTVTFYDYYVSPTKSSGIGSINKATNYGNYTNDNQEKGDKLKHRLSVGASKAYTETKVNGELVNTYVSGDAGIHEGIVTGLSSDYSSVNYAEGLYEPGLFVGTTDKSKGRIVYDNYGLNFSTIGDTWTLSSVQKTSSDGKSTVVDYAGAGFFPLNNENVTGLDSANGGGPNSTGTNNDYFGMRYDISFTLQDYIGALNYSFTGDDDLWVILDGKSVVIDLGGIHDALTKKTNLWDELSQISDSGVTKNADGTYSISEEGKTKEHRLTVLYMERGAYASNCQMNFTIPNASFVTTQKLADLSFNKTDINEKAVAGAEFTLYSGDTAVANATSDADGKVYFSSLNVGTYTLKETSAPEGYVADNRTWEVRVTSSTDTSGNVTYTAKLYDGINEISTIKDYTLDDLLTSDKTAKVTNWDNRTYTINITANCDAITDTDNNANNITQVSGVTVTDVIDHRFNVMNGNEVITADTKGIVEGVTLGTDGPLVTYDPAKGQFTVTWTDQTISKETWTGTINVKAKDDYIGANNVTTNVSPDSRIAAGTSTVILSQPTVNVKVNAIKADEDTTIFLGETAAVNYTGDAGLEKQIIAKAKANLKNYNEELADSNFKCIWYTDDEYYTEIAYKDLQSAQPKADTVYYVKVQYNAGAPTDESNKNTTLDGTAYANSSKETTGEHWTDRLTGTFTVRVVDGQLVITKNIDKQYTDIEKKNAEQTFVYKIQQYAVNDATGMTPIKTFYATIAFNANGTDTSKSATISGLEKGYYTVTEETTWSPKYTLEDTADNYRGNNVEGQLIYIGENKGAASDTDTRTSYTGLNPTTHNMLYAVSYADGKVVTEKEINAAKTSYPAATIFTNKYNTAWKWFSDVAQAVNKFVN